MLKLALVSFVFAFGCSTGTTPATSTLPSTATSSLPDEQVSIMAARFAQLASGKTADDNLEATLTHCRCLDDGWTFVLNPCVQTQCQNLCYHGHHFSPGVCF
jgi:hypothetical protein